MNEEFNLRIQPITSNKEQFKIIENSNDIVVPYLKVVQSMSDELIVGKEKYNPNVKAGDIYDAVTKIAFRNSKVIVCGMRKYYAEWTPNVRGKLIAKHTEESETVKNALKVPKALDNGTCFYDLKTQSGNNLYESFCVVLLIKCDNGILLPGKLPLSKTSFMIGKELSTMLAVYQNVGVPIFTLTTNIANNARGSWYKPVFTFCEYETDNNVIQTALSLNSITDKVVFN